MKYQFYAIIYDVAGNQVSSKSASSPLSITTSIQYVTSLSINPNTAQTKNTGETFTVTPTVTPSNANNKNVNWASSNTTVATVSSTSTASGTAVTVTCKAAGTATITATAADGSGKSVSFTLTVYDKVTISTFSYSTSTINPSQTTLKMLTTSGTAKSGPTYSSSNAGVATVDGSGTVKGVGAGAATITVSYTNYDNTTTSATANITVVEKVTVTTFSYSLTNMMAGATSGMPTKAISGTAKSGPTYSSSNTGIATVDSNTGIVTGVASGAVTITITYTNYDNTTVTNTCNLIIKSFSIDNNSQGAVITCKSSHVLGIALPAAGTSTYYGVEGPSYTDGYTFWLKFDENVVSAKYSDSTSAMPASSTYTEGAKSSINTRGNGWINNYFINTTNRKYVRWEFNLSGGDTVIVKLTKASASNNAKIEKVDILE